jgi:PAS domain-containing protein
MTVRWEGEDLRRRAEDRLQAGHQPGPAPLAPEDLERLVHELQVHQVELELQNEELIRANREVEAANLRFADLYDFAPVGYFTLDRGGIVLGSNITGAMLLGQGRPGLHGRSLAHYLTPESRPEFTRLLEGAAEGTGKTSCEVELTSETGAHRYAQIEAVFSLEGGEYRLAVLDISQRRAADMAREKLVVELQDALARVHVLSGMLPICSSCKKVRDDDGYWEQVEVYVQRHSDAQFSHGLCPDCMRTLYPPEDHPYLYEDDGPTPPGAR